VPDAQGRTIPASVSTGQVHWSIGHGTDRRGIVGRVEQVDLAHGVSSTYACPMPTTDIYSSSWIEPSGDVISVGQYAQFTVWEEDEDAFTHEIGFPYEITDILAELPAERRLVAGWRRVLRRRGWQCFHCRVG
jgi:hypothetical protein